MTDATETRPTTDSGRRDQLYAKPLAAVATFGFDAQVAAVFADMILRSVPGYELTLQMIAVATRQYARSGSNCYDLGCSLGASTLSIRHQAPPRCRIIGVDSSPAMVERCRANIVADASSTEVEIRCEDIRQTAFDNASLVTLNFTLQFVPLEERLQLLQRIHAALLPGGCLILSEKLAFTDPAEQDLLQQLHHGFKSLRGYSSLEIAQKRSALENVLIPETSARSRDAGFVSPRNASYPKRIAL